MYVKEGETSPTFARSMTLTELSHNRRYFAVQKVINIFFCQKSRTLWGFSLEIQPSPTENNGEPAPLTAVFEDKPRRFSSYRSPPVFFRPPRENPAPSGKRRAPQKTEKRRRRPRGNLSTADDQPTHRRWCRASQSRRARRSPSSSSAGQTVTGWATSISAPAFSWNFRSHFFRFSAAPVPCFVSLCDHLFHSADEPPCLHRPTLVCFAGNDHFRSCQRREMLVCLRFGLLLSHVSKACAAIEEARPGLGPPHSGSLCTGTRPRQNQSGDGRRSFATTRTWTRRAVPIARGGCADKRRRERFYF